MHVCEFGRHSVMKDRRCRLGKKQGNMKVKANSCNELRIRLVRSGSSFHFTLAAIARRAKSQWQYAVSVRLLAALPPIPIIA